MTRIIFDVEIHFLVKRYIAKDKEVVQRYGPISGWDVSQVTHMGELFYNQQEFNEHIAKEAKKPETEPETEPEPDPEPEKLKETFNSKFNDKYGIFYLSGLYYILIL